MKFCDCEETILLKCRTPDEAANWKTEVENIYATMESMGDQELSVDEYIFIHIDRLQPMVEAFKRKWDFYQVPNRFRRIFK